MPCGRAKSPSPQECKKCAAAIEDHDRMLAAIEDEDAVARVDARRPATSSQVASFGPPHPIGIGLVAEVALVPRRSCLGSWQDCRFDLLVGRLRQQQGYAAAGRNRKPA